MTKIICKKTIRNITYELRLFKNNQYVIDKQDNEAVKDGHHLKLREAIFDNEEDARKHLGNLQKK